MGQHGGAIVVIIIVKITIDVLELVWVQEEDLEVGQGLQHLLVEGPQLVSHNVQLPGEDILIGLTFMI